MVRISSIAIVVVALAAAAAWAGTRAQGGALTKATEKLQGEVLLTTMGASDLNAALTASKPLEHTSEVARGVPLTAVVRAPGCEKDPAGACKLNADVTVYKPDGTVYKETKNLNLPEGRTTLALTFDSQAPTGVYRLVARLRDLNARRFAEVERMFGVK